jgi:putative aldouronate transport system substrate-binding protein
LLSKSFRITGILLSISILLLAFAACGGEKDSTTNNDNSSKGKTEQTVVSSNQVNQAGDEPKALRVGVVRSSLVTDYEDNKFTHWLEEKLNLEFEFDYFTTEPLQKLEVMISSGSELPEVLCGFELSETSIYNYGRQGIFIPLNSYIDTIGTGMQDAFQRVANKNLRQMMTSPDGNIYYLPRYNEQIGNMWQLRSWINKTWLDNLGLDIPKTTDEFVHVLRAFKTQDPNGNNVQDEIPFVGATGNRQQAADFTMNAFIYDDLQDRWIVENGKLDVPYNKDEWREGLRYLHSLCKEDLLSPLTFTMDDAQLRQLLASGEDRNVVGVFTSNSFGVTPADERRLEYVPLPPLTGPEGVCWAARFPFIPTSRFIITKYAKDPELAYRLGDLMVTRGASIFARCGEKDVDWREPGEGDVGMLEDLGYPATIVPILEFSEPQNSHWRLTHCFVLELGLNDGQTYNPDDILYSERWVGYSLPHYINKAPAETVEQIKYTTEENERIKENRSTLKSYVEESMARFITGDMDIERDWESYVNELNKIGLQEYINVSQVAYDRSINN